MSDLAYLEVCAAAELIRTKKLSPVEYTRALIARVEKHDKQYNAFLRFTPQIPLADAERAQAEIAKGHWRGAWHGVPYALKDIIDYAGLPTTAHSKILQDNVATGDSVVAQRFRAAGAVFMGKLSTHEFATGGPSFDLPWPPARNAWNRGHFPGGSSSGSGAATAAGFVPAALGTDTAGSVRNPATMCGIVGMKPTYGLVSRRGVVPLSFSLDHVGPMTRTVRDNAMLLDLIAGYDSGDPGSVNRAAGGYTTQIGQSLQGVRVGLIRHFYTRDMQADPEMAASIDAAAAKLEALGADVREIETASLDEYAAVNRIILSSEAFAIHEQWMKERPQDYGALGRERLAAGAFIRASDYVNALRRRRQMTGAFHALFSEVDVMITASSMDPACPIDDLKQVDYTYPRQARSPFNVTGSPAISVPSGFSKDGLPLGIQLIGAPFSEALLYRVAHAYEQASPWKDLHPSLV